MKLVIATGIVVDKPTSNGNLYPRNVIEQAIQEFNVNARVKPIKGGIINKKHIAHCGEITHETNSLFINDAGMVCADITLLDPKLIAWAMDNRGFIARPLLSIPSFIENRKPMTVSMINKIVRVQLECDDESDGNKSENP